MLSRLHIDATLAFLTACVALYYRWQPSKRLAFEARNPRFAALLGFLAGLLPFLPALEASARAMVTGQPLNPNQLHPSQPTDTQGSSDESP
jgi:hypothetical protein